MVSMKRRGNISQSTQNHFMFEIPQSAIQDIELNMKRLQIKIITANLECQKVKAIIVELKHLIHLQSREILEILKTVP